MYGFIMNIFDQPMMPGTLQVEAMLQSTVSLIYTMNKVQIPKF